MGALVWKQPRQDIYPSIIRIRRSISQFVIDFLSHKHRNFCHRNAHILLSVSHPLCFVGTRLPSGEIYDRGAGVLN